MTLGLIVPELANVFECRIDTCITSDSGSNS